MTRPQRDPEHKPGGFVMIGNARLEADATAPDLPLRRRVQAVADYRHRANGHTPLGVGQLRRLTRPVDPRTGEVHETPTAARLSNAIRACIDLGTLLPGSTARCLKVPPPPADKRVINHGVWGGVNGEPGEPCPICHPRASRVVTDSLPSQGKESPKRCPPRAKNGTG